jgi:hypothetical protein
MNHSIDDEYLQDCALIWGKPELTEKQCDHFRREFDKLIQVNKGKSTRRWQLPLRRPVPLLGILAPQPASGTHA